MTSHLILAALVVAGIAATPFLLPASTIVKRSAVVDAPAERIFPMIASNSGYQRFNPWKARDPKLKITMLGPDSGVGSGFAFDGQGGKGTQTITALEENASVTMQLDLGPMGRPVTTFRLEPAGERTKVTWSTRAEFGMNPIGRVLGLFLDGMLGSDYELGLKLLGDAAADRA